MRRVSPNLRAFGNVSGQTSIANATLPFTDRLECALPYAQMTMLTTPSSTGLTAIGAFRMNSLYDPDYSGVGHQPYQYDQVAPQYAYQIVRAVKWKVTFNAAVVPGIWVGVNFYNTSNTNGSCAGKSLDIILERNNTKMRPLTSTGSQQLILEGTCHPWKLFGITEQQWMAGTVSYGAGVTGNPLAGVQMEIVIVDPEARTSQNVYVVTELDYRVQFYGLINPLQS